MSHPKKLPTILVRNPAWRRAIERLDESLDQNSEHSYAEKLDLIGRHMFGDLWRERNQNSKLIKI